MVMEMEIDDAAAAAAAAAAVAAAADGIYYRLSSVLRGHQADVRGICICGRAGIATSSHDWKVRFWTPDSERAHRYVLSKTLMGHSSFVGPLAWISPCDRFPEGGVVSGGKDTMVLMWDLSKGEVVEWMVGHAQQVTGVIIDDNGDIISSSLDRSLRRWRGGSTFESWEAHKSGVQALIKLPSGEFVTGSSDSTLKLWRGGRSCLHTFVGHTATVRGLSIMPGVGILSASHDGSIRLWTFTGHLVMEMIGHTSNVFSVHSHYSGLVASGSEDCFLKIWREGICIQSIEHPGCVWDVKFLESGDILTACSDGIVRIWTSHNGRIADPLELEAYELEISQTKISSKQAKLQKLPGLETLKVPGTTDGQNIIIREGDNGVAYSWNLKEQTWDKIGEVVDGPGDVRNNQYLGGIKYDYVFDIDIGDGEPIRQLPYNLEENPYKVAESWLLKENLPHVNRQKVVEFILESSGQTEPSNSFGNPSKLTSKHVSKEESDPLDEMRMITSEVNKCLQQSNVTQEEAFRRSLCGLFLATDAKKITVDMLADTLKLLKRHYPEAYERVTTTEVALQLGQSLLEDYYIGWHPLGQPEHGLKLMAKFRRLLEPDQYERLFMKSVFKPMYQRLVVDWDMTNPEPLLNLFQMWYHVAPEAFIALMGEHLVIPRLCTFIERWGFNNPNMLGVAVIPWIEPYGVNMQPVLAQLQLKEAFYLRFIGGRDLLETNNPIYTEIVALIDQLVAKML